MRGLDRFWRDEKGAVTVEFVVIVPFFIFVMIFFADAATIYLTHTEMYNVARDAARRMATGELRTEDEVVAYASQKLLLGGRTYDVYTGFDKTRFVAVAVPVPQAAIFGFFFRHLLGESLIASAGVVQEPRVMPAS